MMRMGPPPGMMPPRRPPPPRYSATDILKIWKRFEDDDGTPYYFNTITNMSQWKKPEGYLSVRFRADLFPCQTLTIQNTERGASETCGSVRKKG